MTTSRWMAYSLVQDCLKEAIYADWRKDLAQTQRYLSLAQVRLQELKQSTHKVVLMEQVTQARSPHDSRKLTLATLQAAFQYARVLHHCKTTSCKATYYKATYYKATSLQPLLPPGEDEVVTPEPSQLCVR